MIRRIKITAFINAEEEACGGCQFLHVHQVFYGHPNPPPSSFYRCTAFDKWLKRDINSVANTISICRCKECKKSEQKLDS